MTIRATDGGDPVRYSEQVLIVKVARNRHSPEVLEEPYEAEVTQDVEGGTEVARVTARDQDTSVSHRNTFDFPDTGTGFIQPCQHFCRSRSTC